MASSITSVVERVLYTAVEKFCQANGVRASYPNVAFTPDTKVVGGTTRIAPYLVVGFTPNTSELDGIAYDSGLNDMGLLSVNVVWPAGEATTRATQLAEGVVAAFAPGTVLVDGGVVVRVHEQGRVASMVDGTDSVVVPVVVRWVAGVSATGA